MLWLSAALWACHVVAVLVSVLGGCLVGLSCGGAAVVAIEWQLSCIGCLIVHVVTVLWGCPVVDNLASFLGWLSCDCYPGIGFLGCLSWFSSPVMAVLMWLCWDGCPGVTVLGWLSCWGCPGVVVLWWDCPMVATQGGWLSWDGCVGMAVLGGCSMVAVLGGCPRQVYSMAILQ